MLQGMIIKKIMEVVMKQLLKQFKLDKIQKYVEEPNELDKQVKSLQKTVTKYGKYIEEVEKDIAKIKLVAHKPVDWLDKIKVLEQETKTLKDIVSTSSSIKDKFKKLKNPIFK
jgi:myosin heavy subunit